MKRLKNSKVFKLITILLFFIIIALIDSSLNSTYAKVIDYPSGFSDNWQDGLILKKASGRIINHSPGATIRTVNGAKGFRALHGEKFYFSTNLGINISDTSEYQYDINGNVESQGPIVIEYENMASYQGRNVNCIVTFKNFRDRNGSFSNSYYSRSSSNVNKPLLSVSNHFYNGFWYGGYYQVDVDYKFYYNGDNSKKSIDIQNTLFTANSLNRGEGIAYLNNQSTEPYGYKAPGGYVEEARTGSIKYVYGTRQGIGDGWNDVLGDPTFEKASISFSMHGELNSFTYRTDPGRVGMVDPSATWVCPSTAPLGTPKLPPTKDVNKKEVTVNDTIKYTINQRLHDVGVNILSDHYNSFKIEDMLPQGLELKSASISSGQIGGMNLSLNTGGTAENEYGKLGISGNILSYEAKSKFLNDIVLDGQNITLQIECKVTTDIITSNLVNKASTYVNSNKSDSPEVTTVVLPEFNSNITKAGTDKITDIEQRVNYAVTYKEQIKYYQGNATILIVDTLPYPIDTSKKFDVGDGKYDPTNKTITWIEKINGIDSFKNNNNNITITKNISVVFKGINTKLTSMKNIVKGKTSTDTPKADSNEQTATKDTAFDFKIDVIAKKDWDDQGRDRSRRSEPLKFVLYQNGKPTDKSYTLSPKTKDNDEYTFKDLPKYDDNGNRYKYEVKEISKESGNNYYRLQDMKTEVVEGRQDLRFYVDSTTSKQDSYESGGRTQTDTVKNTYKSINIRGNVWLDSGIDGKKANEEIGFKGVNVQLLFKHGGKADEYEYYGYTVRTDQNGNYSFDDIAWNGTYKIRFRYNGQVYETTYYKDDLSGGYSNAKEYNDERNRINTVFENINAYPNNYENGKRAFGLYEKIKNVATNDFIYNGDGKPYNFVNDVLPEFNDIAISYNDYNDQFYNVLRAQLQSKNIDATTAGSIVDYIKDCITYADTQKNYYVTDPQGLNPGSNNTISSVDCGLSERMRSNLSIRNDIYKITYTINGKQYDEYNGYNNKPSNIYRVEDRAKNNYYNGELSYTKPIYKSDYLYNGKGLVPGGENRNLQMYVTYKVIITNNGQVSATVRSIDNYYDSKNYENFSETKNLKACQDNNKLGTFVDEDTNEMLKDYKKLKLTTNNPVLLHPGESTEVDLTFKIKTEYDRVKISDSKRNIVEINSYSTYYMPEDNVVIPDILQGSNKVNKKITERKTAGLVDIDSDPGSLRETDLTAEGNLIYTEKKGTEEYQRIENDTDKAPNLNITFSEDSRSISGFVFEDNRDVIDNKLKTAIGNGKYDNGETKVNGVTVQLVELVRDIDPVTKLQKDNYVGEYVWNEWKYSSLEEEATINPDDKNYYSGKGSACIIISGEGDFKVAEIPLGEDAQGKYQFNSIIPGDYYIRFTYGDTDRTVLTDANSAIIKAQMIGQLDEKNNPLTVNSIVNGNGLNAKSYNGQDYKSTVYEPSVDQASVRGYNGINGYTDYEGQNFINNISEYSEYKGKEEEIKQKNEKINQYSKTKEKMHLYSNSLNDSNAKDLYGDREVAIEYGRTVNNKNGEVLQSYEKLASNANGNKSETQRKMVEELKNNTQMRAQSGVMDIEIVHNNSDTDQATLGLVERAKSQITVTKEVTLIDIVLENGKTLFNTDKSISNLYFGKHNGHSLNYDGYRINTNSIVVNKNNGSSHPELIQAYVDDELMSGATLSTRYRITAKNVGEVDYNDKEFYYKGQENNPDSNITKTNVNRVVDYIPNSVIFDIRKQEESSSWGIEKVDDLVKNGFVTGKYKNIMNTYNSILVAEGLNRELVPEQYKKEDSSTSIDLVLDSALANVMSKDSLVYNNMIEAIQITNNQGRGSNLSIPGNEEMADQTLISNARPGDSVLDRRTPKEIDADSAQRIVIMPPTGEEDYSWLILMSVISAGIIAGGLLIIKKLVMDNNKISE